MRVSNNERLYALYWAVLAGAFVLVTGWAYHVEQECEAKGGKRMRGMWFEGYECYDAKSLKVLP